MKRLMLLAGLLAALSLGSVSGQEIEDQPEVLGTPVVDAGQPTIEEPEIAVDNPDSKLPDDFTTLTALQMWQLLAAGIATGATGFLLRWIPMPVNPDKREDLRKGVSFGVAAVIALIGAWLAGDLDNWQPTTAGIVYVAGLSWFAYSKIPFIKPVANAIEGRS